MAEMPAVCSACGKSFRGWEPHVDGKGNAFHGKCVPKLDCKEIKQTVEKMFNDLKEKA